MGGSRPNAKLGREICAELQSHKMAQSKKFNAIRWEFGKSKPRQFCEPIQIDLSRQLLPCHIQEAQQPPFAAELVHAIEEPLQATEVSLSFNRHEFRFSFSPGIAPEQGDSGCRLGRVTSANQLQTCAFQQFFVFTGERKSNDRSRYALRFPRARPFRPRSAHR